jgi:hypothetical protein
MYLSCPVRQIYSLQHGQTRFPLFTMPISLYFEAGLMPISPYFISTYSSLSHSIDYSGYSVAMPMNFRKLLRNIEPNIVVKRTMSSVTIIRKLLFFDSICRQSANAIAPRISPEYQHTFISFGYSGNFTRQIR